MTDTLPKSVQLAVFSEIGLGGTSLANRVDDQALAKFSADPVGDALVRHWRGRAANKVYILETRAKRIRDRISPQDGQALDDWFSDLSFHAQVAVLAAMAG